MKQTISILMIGNSDAHSIAKNMHPISYQRHIHCITQKHALGKELQAHKYDLVLSNITEQAWIQHTLNTLAKFKNHPPLIIISHNIEEKHAITMLHQGVADVVDTHGTALTLSIERTIRDQHQTLLTLESLEKEKRNMTDLLMHTNHFLRNSIHSIESLFAIMFKQCSFCMKEERQVLESSAKSARVLQQRINDALHLNESESECLQYSIHQFDLITCIIEVVNPFLMTMHQNKMSFSFEFQQVPHQVIADETHLRHIMFSMLDMIAKNTPEGHLIIHTKIATNQTGDKQFIFSIKHQRKSAETNLGIDQVSTNNPNPSMQMMNQFVKVLNANLKVEALNHNQTSYQLTVPLTVVPTDDLETTLVSFVYDCFDHKHKFLELMHNKEKMHDITDGIHGNSPYVLLVDDDPICQLIAQRRLVHAGINVDIAKNGVEAWEMFKDRSVIYDLVLTDLQMPAMSGIELTKRIRRYEASNDLPAVTIIGITAYTTIASKEHCLQVGMDHFLSKPIDAESILNVVTLYNECKV